MKKKWLKITAIVGAAVLGMGSLVLGLRAIFKDRIKIFIAPRGKKIKMTVAKEERIYRHVKVVVNFQLIENPNDKYDMEDILNTMWYESNNLIMITHRLTRAILVETLTEYGEFDEATLEDMTDDELASMLAPYACKDADVIEKSIKDGPVFYSIDCHDEELYELGEEDMK